MSLVPLLPCLEEERHQVRQTFVAGGENVQNRPLDLTLLVLAVGSLEHLTLVQPTRSPEWRPEEGHACGGLKDTGPLRVGSVRVDNSLSAVSKVLSPAASSPTLSTTRPPKQCAMNIRGRSGQAYAMISVTSMKH